MAKKPQSIVGLWFCVLALGAGPACGGAGTPSDATSSAAALTNKLDDDKDGKVDESDEGKDEDEDGKVDEGNEHHDACVKRHHEDAAGAGAAASGEAEDDFDEAGDDAAEVSDGGAAESEREHAAGDHHGKGGDHADADDIDCSDVSEAGDSDDSADESSDADDSADESSDADDDADEAPAAADAGVDG